MTELQSRTRTSHAITVADYNWIIITVNNTLGVVSKYNSSFHTVNASHLHYNIIQYVYEAISGNYVVSARNIPSHPRCTTL